jgi:uncharacterized membrane protein
MARYALIYAATLLAIGVLDAIWLGLVATSWYKSGIGHLMADKPNLAAAAAFYLMYPLGVVVFAAVPAQGDWGKAMAMGALLGLFAYATYDITNLATLRDWPLRVTLVDIAWGGFASAMGAGAGALAGRWMSS